MGNLWMHFICELMVDDLIKILNKEVVMVHYEDFGLWLDGGH